MENIKPLDLIFYKGTSLLSKTITLSEFVFRGSETFSHVGIVVNRDVMPSLCVKDDKLYVWQSTSSIKPGATKDIESGKGLIGVQINSLDDEIRNCNEGVLMAVGKLEINPLDIFEKSVVQETLDRLHGEYLYRPYDNIFSMMSIMVPCLRCYCCYDTTLEVQCSEFLVLILQELKVLDSRIRSQEFGPDDFHNNDTWTLFNKTFVLEKPIVKDINFIKK